MRGEERHEEREGPPESAITAEATKPKVLPRGNSNSPAQNCAAPPKAKARARTIGTAAPPYQPALTMLSIQVVNAKPASPRGAGFGELDHRSILPLAGSAFRRPVIAIAPAQQGGRRHSIAPQQRPARRNVASATYRPNLTEICPCGTAAVFSFRRAGTAPVVQPMHEGTPPASACRRGDGANGGPSG